LESRFQVANSIVSMVESISEPDLDDIVAHCSQVLRERLEVDDVLVSDRHGIVGISPAITRLRDRIDRYARSSAPVLLRGATGTGKELVARALHAMSERHRSPFLALNCAAVPEGVFESQLFGHVAGTFTGATRDQPGLIELAGEGTLFLDEVGELPLGVQAKLLRFLESGEHRRLGSDRSLRSRARILAATHRVLEGSAGFRQDLLHRLQRLEIELPELVDRPEDVRYLARYRVGILNGETGRHWKRLGRAAEDRLLDLRLAGNVRELFNLLDHAWQEAVHEIGPEQIELARQRAEEARRRAASPSQVEVRFGDAASWTLDFSAGRVPLKRLQEQAACSLVRQALEHFGGDAEKVATFLDISRRSVYRYLERDRRAGEDRPAAG
jgi:DNA-binding NtrC family response regulator